MKRHTKNILGLLFVLGNLAVYGQPGVKEPEPVPLEGTGILIVLGGILGIWLTYKRSRKTTQ